MRDHYEVLGLRPDCSPGEVKKAYRRLARQYHPDVYHGPDASRCFDEISMAYQVLSDPVKRRALDREMEKERRKVGDDLHEMKYPPKYHKVGMDSSGGYRTQTQKEREEEMYARFNELSQIWYDRFVAQRPRYSESARRSYADRYDRVSRYEKPQRFTAREKETYRSTRKPEFASYDSIHRQSYGSTGHAGIVKRSYAYMDRNTDVVFDEDGEEVTEAVSKPVRHAGWKALLFVLATFFGILSILLYLVIG